MAKSLWKNRPIHIKKVKTMKNNLDSSSIETILFALDAKNIEEVVERDFADINEQHDVERDKVDLYSPLVRGSIRLNGGLYYTAKEYEERRKAIILEQLP
jgi:hypothetical protein